MRTSGVLWIVQDGVLMGPGASQTLPYLVGLAREGFRLHLLSVEKERFLSEQDRVSRVRGRLAEAGVGWTALPYGRGPAGPRTGWQLLRTAAAARGLCRREEIGLVHARSYLPALVALATGRPFLFDMRGLWPRERVDGGVWREGSAVHRIAGALERTLLRRAAGVVVLARGAFDHLAVPSVPHRVIPTAVDLDRFRPGLPVPPGAEDLVGREVFILAGALGTWYRLDDSLDLLAAAVRSSGRAHVLVLTEEDPAPALAGLARRGVPSDRITARAVPPAEVPNWFSLGAAGILLIESAPSKRASAPTKLGEFLACGVPVLITPGIGDSEEIVGGANAGVVVRERSPAGWTDALARLRRLSGPRDGCVRRCREAARTRLSLGAAVADYAELYREIGGRTSCA